MSIRALKKWALLLTFWVALQTRCLRADQTITGNLTVTGTTDIQGDTLTFGTNSSNSDAGALTLYTDGTISTVEFDASRSANIWKWQQNGSTTLKVQMSLNLNSDNELVLYNQASTPVAEITLNPLGTSSFAGSVTLSGTDNEMPNQTLVNSHSVLTEGLADSRYASSSSVSPLTSGITIGSGTLPSWLGGGTFSNISLNGGTATGAGSFAEGTGSTASDWGSTALGWSSTASGEFSTAMEGSTASGSSSTAMGSGTTASGDNSTAMGQNSIASGFVSTAMGYWTTASGWGSTASGYRTTASGYASTAMDGSTTASGSYSTAMGSGTTASGIRSTAMGQGTTASGTSSTASGGYSTASGTYSTASGLYTTAQAYDSFAIGAVNVGLNANGGTASTTAWVATDPLFEVGNGETGRGAGNPAATGPSDALVVYKNGNAAIQGNLSTGGVITAQPGGDIPMYTGY